MELVSKALERKSFFQELADAGSAKQKDSENLVVFPGGIDQLLCCIIQFGRGVHIWELVLFVKPHRHAKVVLTQEKDIDAWHSGNFVDVLDAIRRLNLHCGDDVIVPIAGITQQTPLVHTALREI